MPEKNVKLLLVAMSDVANGAENVLLMAAKESKAPIIFLSKATLGALQIPKNIPVKYASKKSMFLGFLQLIFLLSPYREGHVLMSTHPYLNAYLGLLKRVGYLKSQLIVRECTSVFTRYSGLKKLSYQLSYQLGYPAANLVVCQTDLMRRQFLNNISFISSDKVIVLENPVDMKLINRKANTSLADPDLNTNFICAAGRLIPEKGFLILIAAFSRIEKQYPDLKLLLFGEGPERNLLFQLISSYGLESRVILKGWISNPLPFFKKAKVCVISSIKEGFPNVLLEMMAVNPLIVSTLCAGGIENIPGILISPVNDVDALEIAIKTALRKKYFNNEISNNYLISRSPEKFMASLLNTV